MNFLIWLYMLYSHCNTIFCWRCLTVFLRYRVICSVDFHGARQFRIHDWTISGLREWCGNDVSYIFERILHTWDIYSCLTKLLVILCSDPNVRVLISILKFEYCRHACCSFHILSEKQKKPVNITWLWFNDIIILFSWDSVLCTGSYCRNRSWCVASLLFLMLISVILILILI